MFVEVTQIKYARFWQRVTALVLDVLIVGIPSFWLSLYISAPLFLDVTTLEKASETNFEFIYQVNKNFVYFMLIAIAIASSILAVFTRSRWQATPGKKIMGICVTANDGLKPKFWSLFARYASLPVFILMLQIFQRHETYQKLEQLHHTSPPPKLADLMQLTSGPIAQVTSVVILTTICFWYLRIVFTAQKTALHDIMFNTRVVNK